MKSSAIKCLTATFLCSLAAQAQTKNVLAAAMSQNETNKIIGSVKLIDSLNDVKRPWETSKYFSLDKQPALQDILNTTREQIKNPRLQKLGGQDGGGGNAQICEEKKGFTIQLLDLADAEDTDLTIDMGPGNHVQKLEYIFNRLAKVVPTYAAYLSAMARDLLTKDAQWPENSAMPIIDDVKVMALKKNCTLVQVAIQRPITQRNIPLARTYIINKDVFSLLDENSKAALILHEVLYRSARFSNQFDSVFTRNLTAIIASKQVLNYTLTSFNKMLSKNNITCLEDDHLPMMKNTNFGNKDSCSFTSYTEMNMSIKNTSHWKRALPNRPWHVLHHAELNGRLELIGTLDGVNLNENTTEFQAEDFSFFETLNDTFFKTRTTSHLFPSAPRRTVKSLFKITGEFQFYPFNNSNVAIVKNATLYLIPSIFELLQSYIILGEMSYNSRNISLKVRAFPDKKVITFIELQGGDSPASPFTWTIHPNPAVIDPNVNSPIYDKDKVSSLKVYIPKVIDVEKDAHGWAEVESVKFTDDNKIVEIYYKNTSGKSVNLNDENLLN